tara:strand:- start:1655 stop:2758 length:1104 start_codon:yes stop_codon:yes gene_type:complete
MKIAFDFKIFSHQKFGGPSRYFYNLFEHIKLINNETNIISPFYCNQFLRNSISKKNIIGFYLPQIKYINFLVKYLNTNISKFLIKKLNPQILHTTDYFFSSSDKHKKLVVTVHDLIHEIFHDEFGKNHRYRPKQRILDLADHIICVSVNTKNDLVSLYNVDEKKISVIYHGNSFSDTTIFQKDNFKKKISFKYFLYIGSRKRYKNFFSIINAIKKNKQIYNDYKVICFGGGKLLKSEITRFKENNIDLKKIIILENNDDNLLFNLYKNASALIYPSQYEGFGMPIVEAMSLGCPVISSNSSSLPEVYGDAALTFSPFSDQEILSKIESIVSDNELRSKLIKLGLNQSKKFSWEKCARETLEVYNKLI